MRTEGRFLGWLAGAALAIAGCRTVAPTPSDPLIPPPAPTVLSAGSPQSLEPALSSLPKRDPLVERTSSHLSSSAPVWPLTETTCRELAATHAPEVAFFQHAEQQPESLPSVSHRRLRLCCESPPEPPPMTRDTLREFAQAEARNTAVAEALEQFYRLADTEGRAELLRLTLPVLDELRAAISKARTEGVRVPTDPAELDRQRGQLLAVIGQADLGSTLLNIDLKRRIGVEGRESGRLWPTGPFPMSDAPIDPEAAVAVALQRRPDLQLLRAIYHHWEHWPREDPQTLRVNRRWLERVSRVRDWPIPDDDRLTRQQLFDLIAAKERIAADEARAAVATLQAQTREVGLARWRVEHLAAEVEKAQANGPLAVLPAQIDVLRARGEVLAAFYAWQQARVKLLAAQGAFAEGP